MPPRLRSYLPILDWGARYDRAALSNDLIAAVIVTIMLRSTGAALLLLLVGWHGYRNRRTNPMRKFQERFTHGDPEKS